MDLLFSIACQALKSIAIGITLLNELTLFAIPWICAPSTAPRPATPFPHPALTSITYAITEPLWVALLAKTAIEPWILVFNTPQHLLLCIMTGEYLSYLGRSQTWQHPLGHPVADQAIRKSSASIDPELQPTVLESNPVWQPKWQACIVAFIMINSVAASNAAFLLFAADLESKLSGEETVIMLFFGSLAVILYLISRISDFQMARTTEKKPLWRHQSFATLRVHLSCLDLVLSVKIMIRWLLSHSVFPVLQIMSSRQVVPALAEHMPTWLAIVMEYKPTWLRWVTSVWSWVSIPLQVYGFYLFRKGLEQMSFER